MWLFGLRMALGVFFFLLGIIGVLVPVMPQLIFFIISGLMFFPRHRRLNVLLSKAESRMPRLVAWVRRIGIGVPAEPVSAQSTPLPSHRSSLPIHTDSTDRDRYPE